MATMAAMSGAIFNVLNSPDNHGRVTFVSSYFGISRPSLYQLCTKFTQTFCRGPGRPRKTDEQRHIESLQKQVNDLSKENEMLREELEKQKRFEAACVDRLKFSLTCLGLTSRLIADVLKDVFGVKTNHTTILLQMRLYAKKASQIMKKWFWPTARDVDIDEVFIENEPLYVAVDPKSMAICKTEKHTKVTTENWQQFSAQLSNLQRTTSDRGPAIVGAVGDKENHIHQSDLFHLKRLIGDELRKKETLAYKAIAEEEKAQKALEKQKRRGKDGRAAAQKCRVAKRKANEAIELFDNLEEGVNMVYDAFKFTTPERRLNSATTAQNYLDFVFEWFQFLLPNSWRKVKNALKDPHLLTYLGEFKEATAGIHVQTTNPKDREYILATLTKLWEEQAKDRWRGKDVNIPRSVEQNLAARCANLSEVIDRLFTILDDIHRASSAVESVNSRIGLYRYNKRRFSGEFADLIAVWHNLSPFKEGKRKGKSPAQLLGLSLPTFDPYELIAVN